MRAKIGFVGMTHLGIVSAVGIASKGFDVVCFDVDVDVIANLNADILPVVEPDLKELFLQHKERFQFSSDPSVMKQCELVYVASDVPTDETGKSNLSEIEGLIKKIIPNLSKTAILVVLCQVPPGFTRKLNFEKKRLYYQVETLIFGRAVERTLNPERYIVGCDNPDRSLPSLYKSLLEAFDCPILQMRYESAELAKISINMCLVASVSVANTLAELCEKIKADWSEIVPSLRLDRRIGKFSYIEPGLGISGGNLERDLATVIQLSDIHSTDSGVVRAWLQNSRHRKQWVYEVLRREVLEKKEPARIGVLGLAYKENTHSTKNSPSLVLLKQLASSSFDVKINVHDPVVAPDMLDMDVEFTENALDVADSVDALIVMTPWPEYKDIDIKELSNRMDGNVLIDPLRVYDRKEVNSVNLDYFTLGAPVFRA